MNTKEYNDLKGLINKPNNIIYVWVKTTEQDGEYIRAYKNDVLLKLKSMDFNKVSKGSDGENAIYID